MVRAELVQLRTAGYAGRSLWQATFERGGLRIAIDTCAVEQTSDPQVPCGGGEAVCGGYGTFLGWLRLAGAYRDAGMVELMSGDDWEMYFDTLRARPVIDLS